jgi:glycosyltransferase involved in cell wall biosynthesis
MIKILFILDGLRSGGKERRFVSLLKHLSGLNNYKCKLVLLNEDIHFEEVHSYPVEIEIIKRRAAKDIRPFIEIYKIRRIFKPDIIHAWDNLSTLFSLPSIMFSSSKLVTSRINHVPPSYKKLSLFGIQAELGFLFSSAVLSNSASGVDAYRAPKKKTTVIYNGFDLERIQNLKSEKDTLDKFGIIQSKIVGMVASFTDLKDYASFLDVANRITQTDKDIAFLCVGDGFLREQFQKQYSSNKQIYFLGRQSDIEALVNTFHLGVLCTITEGISNTVMEYMALKKPVIVTGGGGTKELISHGHTGYLFDAYDRDRLESTIRELIINEILAADMGSKGYNRIVDHFSMEKMMEGFENVYKKLANDN